MQTQNTNLKGLNKHQKEAVIKEAPRLLVLAGAGSGKTKTLIQKILYLIDEKEINPSEILAITFSKPASKEMIDRLLLTTDDTGDYSEIVANKNLTKKERDIERQNYVKKFKWIDNLSIGTFHSMCYHILRDYGVKEFDNKFKIISDTDKTREFVTTSATETTFDVMHKIVIEQCASNEYLLQLKRFVLDYLSSDLRKKRNTILNTHEESKVYISLNGTKVRSKSEQYIADWLFRHNIVFEYEMNTNLTGEFNFRPDFFIPEADLYLEHVSDISYPTKQKEDQYRKTNRVLKKTFEKHAKDTALFNLELEKIVKERLPANYHFKVSLSFEEEFKNFNREVKDFIELVVDVMHKIKLEQLALDDIFVKSQNDQHERVRNFYKLTIPIIEKYKQYCINKSYLDYDDLIANTISLFQNQPEIKDKFQQQYRYILVDEFQDVNNLQVNMIKEFITKNNQLFCVGDDWQSIYGFRGSNVDYVVNFDQHFHSGETMRLNMNYRSAEHIVNASNEVIAHNKFKIEKEVTSSKKSVNKVNVYAGKTIEENVQFLIDQVQHLQNTKGYSNDDILILYRRSKMIYPYLNRLKQERIFVSTSTIHSAKGLEAKAVFIVGLNNGSGGFPDIWMQDRIIQVIRESNHNALMEEERRMFYVAITRAKDELFLLCEKGNESPFIGEISKDSKNKLSKPLTAADVTIIICDHCNQQIQGGFSFCPNCGKASNLDN